MGVVRREGNWRLEKRDEGVYEITYEKEPREKILTPEYTPGMMDSHGVGMIPVHEVESYAEAEGLFEERANGGQAARFGPSAEQLSLSGGSPNEGSSVARNSGGDETIDLALPAGEDGDLPPGGVALVAILTGIIATWTSGFQTSSIVFLSGSLFFVLGVSILGWALISTETIGEAIEMLGTVDGATVEKDGSDDGTEKTPPTPKKLKNDLYFERADQECEWCGEHVDQPEVHHIIPRSEGGPNERSNLIVLCPNHHRKADAGAISRSKLKSKVRRLERS
ncbi:HNH endonuclease [Halosimplex sp. TS25]|uniref:HNH endonuclease n=1 Tax=Halosimplex rarum TaxID=3396619 RepID=UPI0039E8E7C4